MSEMSSFVVPITTGSLALVFSAPRASRTGQPGWDYFEAGPKVVIRESLFLSKGILCVDFDRFHYRIYSIDDIRNSFKLTFGSGRCWVKILDKLAEMEFIFVRGKGQIECRHSSTGKSYPIDGKKRKIPQVGTVLQCLYTCSTEQGNYSWLLVDTSLT